MYVGTSEDVSIWIDAKSVCSSRCDLFSFDDSFYSFRLVSLLRPFSEEARRELTNQTMSPLCNLSSIDR